MDREQYERIERYMRKQMRMCDGAHDAEHVLRVLGVGLDIAAHEPDADVDVVIAACLLHDVGRREQMERGKGCHARIGAKKAEKFLKKSGFGGDFARHVADCVRTHRFRSGDAPETIEAKILYDADKVDVCGATGVARTLFYQGRLGGALYSLTADGAIADRDDVGGETFFGEYRYKLERIGERLLTPRGREIALERRTAAQAFYESMLAEVRASREEAAALLERALEGAP